MKWVVLVLAVVVCRVSLAVDLPPDLDDPVINAKLSSLEDASAAIDKLSRDSSLPKTGLFVAAIEKGGPASDADLKTLDIITAIDKKSFKTADEYRELLRLSGVGKSVEFTYYRTFKTPAKKLVWKKHTTTITPISKREQILSSLKENFDKVNGTSTFVHKSSPSAAGASEIVAYIFKSKDGKLSLQLRISYVATDWLFVKGYQVKVDNADPVLIAPKPTEFSRDNTAGKVWEWYSCDVDEKKLELLESIVSAKSTTIRSIGKQYNDDRDINAAEKNRLATVLVAYKIMSSK